MNLSFCPICKNDIPDKKLGWICWQPESRNSSDHKTPDAAPERDGTQQEEARQFYNSTPATSPSTSAGYRGEPTLVLCNQYNAPPNKCCMNGRCGNFPRDPTLSCPACPICNTPLPFHSNLHARAITVTGPRNAGKTHFIVALNDWWDMNLPKFNLRATRVMKKIVEQSFDAMRDQIRHQNERAGATLTDRIFSYAWHIARSSGSLKDPSIVCTMPDVSGENLMSVPHLVANRHYRHTSGIVLLLDGDRIATARGLIQYGHRPDDHVRLITAMIDYLILQHQDKSFDHLPIAVCINKVDTLAKLDDEWGAIIRDYSPDHDGYCDFTTCQERSDAIEALLLEHPETSAVVYRVKGNFKRVMFFPVATIGSDETPIRFRPMFVEDPFLWLLYQMTMIRGR